jgi:hypothetical protein
MVSGSLSFSELVVMGQRASVQERALAKGPAALEGEIDAYARLPPPPGSSTSRYST